MRLFLFLIMLNAAVCCDVRAQVTFKPLSEMTTEANRFVVDELGNIYLMTGMSIERRNAVGTGVFRASELQWGEFHDLDVTDPLRPFAHFPASGKVVFFDNTLSVQGSPIDLFESGFDNVEWMCGSRGDGFWLWDARNSELVRVDRSFKKRYASGNLSVLLNSELHPTGMMERGSFLYVMCDDETIHVFDMFGAWKKRIAANNLSSWMADAGHLYLFHKDGTLEAMDTRYWLSEHMGMPQIAGSFSYQASRIYILSEGHLRIFEIVENTRN